MPDKSRRYKDNIRGKFYVDTDCIDCGLCSQIAPQNFCHSKDKNHDIVYKQPTDNIELELCLEAVEYCPVEAIGSDGE